MKWEDIKENTLVTFLYHRENKPDIYNRIYVSKICDLFDGGLSNENNYLLYDLHDGQRRLYKEDLNNDVEIVDIREVK